MSIPVWMCRTKSIAYRAGSLILRPEFDAINPLAARLVGGDAQFHRPRLDRRIAEGTRRRDIAVEVKARSASDGRPPGSSFEDLAGKLDSLGKHLALLSLNVLFGGAKEREDWRTRLAADALARVREHVPIEEGKFRLGLTSASRVDRVRSELMTAETRDVGAKIDDLNARPELERIEGLVLWTWKPGVDDGAGAVPVASEIRLEERQT